MVSASPLPNAKEFVVTARWPSSQLFSSIKLYNMQVADNMVVALRYVMKNAAGDILENTMEQEPVEYVHGSGKILPQLEQNLEGMTAGERRSITFHTGREDEIFHFDVVVERLRPAEWPEMQTGQVKKDPTASNCGPGCCC